MREHGWENDAWPDLYPGILDSDILVVAGPIWLGDNASVTKQLIERIYSLSGMLNDKGQYLFYGRVAGCLITGNEDGIKHCAQNILYSLQHVGYTIPPNADAGWIGEAGPGPSYLDPGSGGPENDFTNRNTTFMTWNLLHLAKMLKTARWCAGVRQPALGVERRHPVRLGEPGVPQLGPGRVADRCRRALAGTADVPGPVIGEDGVARCPWGAGDAVNMAYHDTEWGMPVRGEAAYLERLTLEAFQSGLSWRTILNKREAFREVFHGFDADTIAAFGPERRRAADGRAPDRPQPAERSRRPSPTRGRPLGCGSGAGSRRSSSRSGPSCRRRRRPPRRWWPPRRSRSRCRRL